MTIPGLTSVGVAAVAPGSPQASDQVSAADAAPFLGDWAVTAQGPNGPATFGLSLKVEKEKVVGEITSDAMPAQAVTDVSKSEKNLLLRYSFLYEGNPVATVVTLTPVAEEKEKITVQFDFAGGAYIMTGTGARKDKPKN